MLRENRITQAEIATRARISVSTAGRALGLSTFDACGYGMVSRARWAAERALIECGIDFDPGSLWSDYQVVF